MTADPGASTIPGSTRGAFRFPWLLPVGTGLLLAFSFPPRSVPGLGFVALAPLVLSVEGLADGQEYRAARRGLLAGVIAWGLLLPWIPSALGPVTSLAPLVYPVGVLVMASFLALFTWTTARLRHSGRVPLWMAVPVSWTGVEWLRAHLGPLSFPWLELGVSLADTPMLLAPAEVVGGRGLGFWMALTAALLVRLGSSRAGGRRGWTAQPPRLPASLAPWIPLVAVLALPALWGAWRNDSLVLEPVGRVALFQPNLSRAHTGARPAADTALARLADLVGRVPRGSIDLAVWPEGVVASDPRRDAGLSDRISSLVDQLGAPVLLGAYLREHDGSGEEVTFNGALLWAPGSGDTGYAYRKRRLVPGVEVVPFFELAAPPWAARLRGFGRGRDVGVPSPPAPRFVPLVCYEAIFADDAREGVSAGGRLLVNLTNDVWFSGRPGGRPTAAMTHHPAHLVLRAVELRTGAARSANSGISLFVHPTGRVSQVTVPMREDVRVDTVWASPRPTIYARVGDVAGSGSALVAAVLLLVGRLRPAGTRGSAPRRASGPRVGPGRG